MALTPWRRSFLRNRTFQAVSDSLDSLRRKLSAAEQLGSVVRAMKAISASSIVQYEKAVDALGQYQRSVELGQSLCRDDDHPVAAPTTARDGPPGALIFGTDQGLVGRFNEAIGEFAGKALRKMPGPKTIWTVGERVCSVAAITAGIAHQEPDGPGPRAVVHFPVSGLRGIRACSYVRCRTDSGAPLGDPFVLKTPIHAYTPADRKHREELIRQAAYARSQLRRPCIEHQIEDWLAAEAEVDAMLTFHSDGQGCLQNIVR